MKVCTRCEVSQSEENFYLKVYGLQSWCKTCCNAYSRAYEKTNRERLGKQKYKRTLKRVYNLDQEDYDLMIANQNSACKICKRDRKLHVDHSHETGAVRGLLCPMCNKGLGCFEDNPQFLLEGARYLNGIS